MKKELKYANITDRLFAGLLDLSLLYFIVVPLSAVIFQIIGIDQSPIADTLKSIAEQYPEIKNNDEALVNELYYNHQDKFNDGIAISIYQGLIQLAMMSLYFIPLTKNKGTTLGKYIIGLEVIDNINHEKISLAQSIIRYVGYIVSGGVLFLGFIWGGFRKDKRCWHDFLADSCVIYSEGRWYKALYEKLIAKIKSK